MKDLLDSPEDEWRAERSKMLTTGWGSRFLAAQQPDGSWPKGRWLDTVWTLVSLADIGMPAGDFAVKAFEIVVGRLMPRGEVPSRAVLTTQMDLCHLGFWLRIGGRFLPSDPRLKPLADIVLGLQLADGGWNCRVRVKPHTEHSSFHTTFNVLEGLREVRGSGVLSESEFRQAEARAIEFMLEHRLFRSDKTGEVINSRFLDLTYPSYWHYTVLRGLDYMKDTAAIRDPRLSEAIEGLATRRKPNGIWPVEKRIPGLTHFEMEKMGRDSRWVTLKALSILRAAGLEN